MSITLTLGDKKWKVFEEYECSVLSSHWIHFSVLCSMAKESGETHPSLEETSERFEGENRRRCGSKELKVHKRVETESESWGWGWEWFHPLFSCIITPREMFGLEGRRVSRGQTEGGVVPLSHCSPTTTLKWLRTDRVFPEKNSHSTLPGIPGIPALIKYSKTMAFEKGNIPCHCYHKGRNGHLRT